MWTYIQALKDTLSKLDGVKTCKVGIEPTLNADSYPMIRIVPSEINPVADHYSRRTMTVLIYFGANNYESQVGMEEVEHQLFLMEQKIRDNCNVGAGFKPQFFKTYFDESRLQESFRVMCLILKVTGEG